jgi:hypothetical protein
MAVAQHIEALAKTHADVDALVRMEQAHAWVNRDKVIQLKLRKLHLKEQIQRLKDELRAEEDLPTHGRRRTGT